MKRFVLMAIGAVVSACTGGGQVQPQVVEGTLQNLPEHLQRLLEADPARNPILVIQVAGSADRFIQFSVGENSVQLDHPLITEEQRNREQQVREALIGVGCTPQVNQGSDGGRFLDCELPRSLEHVLSSAEAVMRSGLGVLAGEKLTFTAVRL